LQAYNDLFGHDDIVYVKPIRITVTVHFQLDAVKGAKLANLVQVVTEEARTQTTY